jgi:hypothetical protein
MDFDLFARSSVSETVSGDCCLKIVHEYDEPLWKEFFEAEVLGGIF